MHNLLINKNTELTKCLGRLKLVEAKEKLMTNSIRGALRERDFFL